MLQSGHDIHRKLQNLLDTLGGIKGKGKLNQAPSDLLEILNDILASAKQVESDIDVMPLKASTVLTMEYRIREMLHLFPDSAEKVRRIEARELIQRAFADPESHELLLKLSDKLQLASKHLTK